MERVLFWLLVLLAVPLIILGTRWLWVRLGGKPKRNW